MARFFNAFELPKRLQPKNQNDVSNKAYSIYKVITMLMAMNQQLPDIKKLDFIEAFSFIQDYAKLHEPKKKRG